MTAVPDPQHLVADVPPLGLSMTAKASITETYWGIEIAPAEQIIDLVVLARWVAVVVSIAMLLGAAGVWLVPGMAFESSALSIKLNISMGLFAMGVGLGWSADRSSHVLVQIDTCAGEVREVVARLFGGRHVLSRHGMEAVRAVDVIQSRTDTARGQVVIRLADGTQIPAGDGPNQTLEGLRRRLRADCGLDQRDTRRDAVWSGPLAA